MNWERRVEDHERGRVLSVNGKCMQTPRGTDHFLLGLGTGHWLLRGEPSPDWSLQEATLGRASELAGPACSGLCSSGLCVGIPLSPLGGTQRSSHHPRPHSTSPPCVLRATPHLRSSQPRAALGMDTGSLRGHSSCHLCPPSPALLTLATPWVMGRAAFQHVALLYEVRISISSARCEIHNTR